ncbi:flagellar hook assembly protein FlgD [Rickettsia endosymbiont of Cardiosporidium cionae]|uniref:flagellar hook assembly protein FlgD n=1 Tax=Rickettsia endosymbiont of Cardiosporidium cionae TaxID=2777155 RepID=UPI0018932FB0|nr:FlgD immunoglobulin-like domain containing protein [Rickettsia endosymbiont of Cardiosporidium cionae]KAF8818563.1 hypothetical protein IHI24_000280 [Rickettsia endosymbiont of Cardiosporidium cionae]
MWNSITSDFGRISNQSPNSRQNQNSNFGSYAEIQKTVMELMVANLQNADPFNENQNLSKDMLENNKLFLETQAMELQSQQMSEMSNSIESAAGFNYLGKMVNYPAKEEDFDGNTPVEFAYNLDINDNILTGDSRILSNIKIFDMNECLVYSTQSPSNGTRENIFRWPGQDNAGNLVPKGRYYIEVQSKIVDNDNVTKKIIATNTEAKSKVVELILDNGLVTKLKLENGKIIDRKHVATLSEIN